MVRIPQITAKNNGKNHSNQQKIIVIVTQNKTKKNVLYVTLEMNKNETL